MIRRIVSIAIIMVVGFINSAAGPDSGKAGGVGGSSAVERRGGNPEASQIPVSRNRLRRPVSGSNPDRSRRLQATEKSDLHPPVSETLRRDKPDPNCYLDGDYLDRQPPLIRPANQGSGGKLKKVFGRIPAVVFFAGYMWFELRKAERRSGYRRRK